MKKYWAIPIMMGLSLIFFVSLMIYDIERGGRGWDQTGYALLYTVLVGIATLVLIWIGMAIKAMLKAIILAILK